VELCFFLSIVPRVFKVFIFCLSSKFSGKRRRKESIELFSNDSKDTDVLVSSADLEAMLQQAYACGLSRGYARAVHVAERGYDLEEGAPCCQRHGEFSP
jgi:hypothetical protein